MGRADGARGLFCMLMVVCYALLGIQIALGATDSRDVIALRSLMSQWENTPPSWGKSDDPCGSSTPWDGVKCSNSRVISLQLSSMNLKGKLHADIGLLSQLNTLDLSYNKELGGQLTPNIGNLKMITTLILAGCSFTGSIPQELGNLPLLSYLALNTNKFTGNIPASLGALSKLIWFDIAENQLTGTIPVSSGTTPGLDQLFDVKHFHFNKNNLSGSIPPQIFNSKMTLIHVLFDSNQLTGSIPESIGLVKTLEVLRLDRNKLKGPIPLAISNLTSVHELNLANNQLTGTIPDLTGMSSLISLDLSNNSFSASEAPAWFTSLPALTTLVLESSRLSGHLPQRLFAVSQLQQVWLKNNDFNGTLDLSDTISRRLQLVDLRNNKIDFVSPRALDNVTLLLYGNPVCKSNDKYCRLQQPSTAAYSTSLGSCAATTCPNDQSVVPFSCECAYPYQGLMVFIAPTFSDLTNSTRFQQLESSLTTRLTLNTGAATIQNLEMKSDGNIQLKLSLFPSSGVSFNRTEIQRLGFYLSSQTYRPPAEFGPYIFTAFPYTFVDSRGGKSSLSAGAVIGIVIACSFLLIGLVLLGIYAIRQKKRAEKAMELANPFASWAPSSAEAGGVPQLKGSRPFTFTDLKKITNNFSESNQIGVGGYGRVYKATLSSGQVVAIKRAQRGSTQGALEFKTEIELLSRVHHKNLVGLVGFCYDQEEQMLIYEYVPNGTLRELLAGKSGIRLDWSNRLKIALGSARGLAYLHELADPPIIHRDIKSMNILLDETLTAKVADFGLSTLVSDSEKGHISTQVKGTLGYLDPEYYMTQQLTEKSDVYSFGIVMMELITSRLPIEKNKYTVKEIKAALDWHDELHCGLSAIIDPFLVNMQLPGFPRFLDLALRCVRESASDRPSMSEVVKEIEAIAAEQSSATSNTSSATEFSKSSIHPYDGKLPSTNSSSNAFENSTGYTFSSKIEPK